MTKNKKIIIIIGAIALGLILFQAGVLVGYHKALFSYHLNENYYHPFGRHDDLAGGHGAVGKIVRLTLPTIIVASPDNLEKVVLINNETVIRRFRDTASTTDLALNEAVVVLGVPNDQGQVVAKLIRILAPSSQ